MSLPNTIVNDFYLEVIRGNTTNFVAKDLQGANADVDAGTEDIWNEGGDITQVTTAATLRVSSSAAADITQSVTITGLDTNYDEVTEVIDLDGTDGTTIVVGTVSFLRVNSAVLSAACAGDVYVYYVCTATAGVPDDLTKVQAKIDIAALRAYNAIYTVPRNKNWYLTSLRYRSAGSIAAHDVVISAKRKLYGGAVATIEIVKYKNSATATNFTDAQVQFTDQPVTFPAKSEIRFTCTLGAGGSNLNIALEANFIEESITAVANTVTVLTMAEIVAKMATAGTTHVSQNHWLIGLDEVPGPNVIPTTVDLDDVLTTITGKGHLAGVIRPYVAATTDVAFDPAYFSSGKLVSTTKKAVFTIMRCVDSAGTVDYVQAYSNMIFSLGNCKKITYLTQ
jgi:hypothetical protein